MCFKQWFQFTADAHPGVSGVSKDQKFCEKFKTTHSLINGKLFLILSVSAVFAENEI